MLSSKKRLWVARLLALLIMSLAFSLLLLLTPEGAKLYTEKVEIRTNENIGEIVAAVESLGRDNILIKTREASWLERNLRFPYMTVGYFISLGLFLGFYHVICCAINGLFGWTRYDNNFPTSDRDTLLKPHEQVWDLNE